MKIVSGGIPIAPTKTKQYPICLFCRDSLQDGHKPALCRDVLRAIDADELSSR